jgi:hypothetical protein
MLIAKRRKKPIIIYGMIFFITCFFNIDRTHAGNNSVFINEVMWRGSSVSSSDEWMEIINNSKTVVDISGYQLFDEIKGSKIVDIKNASLDPGELFLISNNSKDHVFSFGESVLNIDPNLIDSALSLSNSSLKITLRDQNSNIIDQVGNGLSSFFPESEENFRSLQRVNYSKFDGGDPQSWRLSDESINIDEGAKLLNFATPGSKVVNKISNFRLSDLFLKIGNPKEIVFSYDLSDTNEESTSISVKALTSSETFTQKIKIYESSFSLPVSSGCWQIKFNFILDETSKLISEDLDCFIPSNKVLFSEVLTAPKDVDWNKDGIADSRDEWVEIHNSSNASVNLSGWKIVDKSNKTAVLLGLIKPDEYRVLYYNDLLLSLNNSGETLLLVDPSGETIDRVVIPSLKYNESYSKIAGTWNKVLSTSPGLPNISDPISPPREINQTETDIGSSEISSESISNIVKNEATNKETVETKILNKQIPVVLAVFSSVERKNLPVLETGQVLGSSSQRYSAPFISNQNLLYFISVFSIISVTSILIVISHEIYRRE